jgi:hypothetical protein
MQKQLTIATLLAVLPVSAAVASDYEDFDGQPNSNGVRYIESYTAPGYVPPAPAAPGRAPLDAMPTQVLASPQTRDGGQGEAESAAWKSRVRGQFRSAYKSAGEPSIAVFWNREFNDQLSQWHADKRVVRTGEQATNSTDKFEPSAKGKGWERNMTGGSRIVEAQYFAECKAALVQSGGKEGSKREYTPELCYQVLNRRAPAGDSMGHKATEFGFNSGFMGPLLNTSVKVLDRSAIMRLTQRDTARKAGAELISDSQKVESDALIGYADYFAEIIYSSKPGAHLGVEFLVSVKEVSTGRVVAMFRTEGEPPSSEPVTQWVATANGFIEQTAEAESNPKEVGEQLAYETMEALARVW